MNPQSSSSDKDDTPTNNDNDMANSQGEIVDNNANTIISSGAVQGGESKHTIDLQLINEHDSHNDGSSTTAIPSHPENSTGLTSEGSSQSTNIMHFHSATAGGSEDNTNSAVITHDDNVNINNNNIVDRKALMTDDCYCAYSKRNVDAHGRVMTIDDDNSPFCKMPPPGADAFVAWYIDGKFHDEELMKADKDYDDNTTSNRNNEPTEEAGITDEGVLAMEEQRLLEDPVRRFMGPIDISLGLQFRQRRRRYYELNEGDYRNQKAINYDSVSYKKLDTPVWHNYTMEIQRQGDNNNNKKKYGHVINKQNISRRRTTGGANLSRVSQPDMAPTRKQFRTRPFIGCLRKFLSLPRSRANTGPDHPVNTLQQDTRILTRIVLIVLGISVSLLSKAVGESMNALLYWKLSYVTTSGSHYDNGDSPPRGFGTFLGFNLLFVTLAFLPILYRPVAAGSGIAEAKAVLNGIILPKSTDLLTALFKAISVIFTGAASMPIGLEGPLIFMGMALGENAQRFLPKAYAGLKVDRLKRDFAVIGTSCGVTGAFLSPIGGVLFAMEEGASFWNTRLSWSAFAASCVTALTMYVWGLVLDKDFKLDVNSMAIYSGLDGENVGLFPTFNVWDYIGFVVFGVAGGIAGAMWIHVNKFISIKRSKVPARFTIIYKVVELLILSLLVSALLWYLPHVYTVCSDISITTADDKSLFRQMNCPPGQYNHLGTLFLNPVGSVGLNMLYWEPSEVFHPVACLIAGSVYFVLLLLLFGTSVSMGIFIPLLFIGACFGRAISLAIGMDSDVVRTYAIVASVGMLAGVVRVLISISAIIITCTSLTYMVTPFMVATIFARVMGKAVFGEEGIYDVILDLKGIPFLEAEPPKSIQLRGLRAQDVMSRSLVTLQPDPTVGRIMEVLEKYPFLDFPVVDPTRGGIFIGIITRDDLLTLLSHTALFIPSTSNETSIDTDSHFFEGQKRLALRFEELVWQRYRSSRPTVESLQQLITEEHRKNYVIDLTPYIEIGHYTLNRLVSIERAYELFRSLGLRYLIITDPAGRPVGAITRYDLKLLEEVGVDELKLARKRSNVGIYSVS